MFVAETHLTDKNYTKIPFYNIYATNHLSGKARGGTAVIIKNDIKHFLQTSITHMNIQAILITINTTQYKLTLAAVYCPLKQKFSLHQFTNFFQSLRNKFIAGGDFNAKHAL